MFRRETAWALEENTFNSFMAFKEKTIKMYEKIDKDTFNDLKADFEAQIQDSTSTGLAISEDGTANIKVEGVLQREIDICTALFSNATSYHTIIDNIKTANDDPKVQKIVLDINSPGGAVDGVDEVAQAIQNSEKPVIAVGHYLVASAAYWIASQADEIKAASPTSSFGSIGVAMELLDNSKSLESRGLRKVTVTSSDAPLKRPDITTDEGIAHIRERLDDIHKVFVSRIIEGRNNALKEEKFNEKIVNKTFGRGSVLIAEDALNAGMIDNMMSVKMSVSTGRRNSTLNLQKGEDIMDKEQLIESLKTKGIDVVSLQETAEKVAQLEKDLHASEAAKDVAEKALENYKGGIENEKIEQILTSLIAEGKSTQIMNDSLYRDSFKAMGSKKAQEIASQMPIIAKLAQTGSSANDASEKDLNDEHTLDTKIKNYLVANHMEDNDANYIKALAAIQ